MCVRELILQQYFISLCMKKQMIWGRLNWTLKTERRKVCTVHYSVKSYEVNEYNIWVRFYITVFFSFSVLIHSIYHGLIGRHYFAVSLEEEWKDTYLLFLLIEVINDDTNEQIQGEKRPKNDKDDKIQIHVQVVFILGLL